MPLDLDDALGAFHDRAAGSYGVSHCAVRARRWRAWAATSADLLPVYRFLGERLVAEVCLRRAIAETAADQSAAEARSAAAVPIKYTRSAHDLPDSPTKRQGCFGFFLVLLSVGASALTWGIP